MKLFFREVREMRWNEVKFMKFIKCSETRLWETTTRLIEFYQKAVLGKLSVFQTYRSFSASQRPSLSVCAKTGVLPDLTSTKSVEHGSSDNDNLDDGKSGASGASQKALPALQKKQGQKRRIRSSGESHPPQVKRVQDEYNAGSVTAEGKRSARMRTPKNLDLWRWLSR